MSGFVEIGKIVIRIGFWALILAILISIIGSAFVNILPVISFLDSISSTLFSVIEFAYNVLYYWTVGAFEYIFIATLSILVTKLLFWLAYWLLQGYKIVSGWLMK